MIKGSHITFRASALCAFLMGVAFWPSFSISADKGIEKPSIVSLDFCSDQFVLYLADKEQITAVSKAAEDIHSFYRERAQDIPKSNSTIEEVIMLNPDVVIQTYSSAAHMAEMTERTGISLIATEYGSDPDTVYKNMAMLGKVVGQEERAVEFNQNYERRLKEIKAKPQSKLTVAYITPSGTTAGVGTSVDDIIKLSGFESYAAVHNFNGWLSLPVENLVMDPPDIFITGYFEEGAVTQSSWSLARHDYLFKMMKNIPTINIPSSYMSCNGLFIVDAAERIRAGAVEKGVLSKESGDE